MRTRQLIPLLLLTSCEVVSTGEQFSPWLVLLGAIVVLGALPALGSLLGSFFPEIPRAIKRWLNRPLRYPLLAAVENLTIRFLLWVWHGIVRFASHLRDPSTCELNGHKWSIIDLEHDQCELCHTVRQHEHHWTFDVETGLNVCTLCNLKHYTPAEKVRFDRSTPREDVDITFVGNGQFAQCEHYYETEETTGGTHSVCRRCGDQRSRLPYGAAAVAEVLPNLTTARGPGPLVNPQVIERHRREGDLAEVWRTNGYGKTPEHIRDIEAWNKARDLRKAQLREWREAHQSKERIELLAPLPSPGGPTIDEIRDHVMRSMAVPAHLMREKPRRTADEIDVTNATCF